MYPPTEKLSRAQILGHDRVEGEHEQQSHRHVKGADAKRVIEIVETCNRELAHTNDELRARGAQAT